MATAALAEPEVLTVRPFWAGDWHDGEYTVVIDDKFTDRPLTHVSVLSRPQLAEAVGAVVSAQRSVRLTLHERHVILVRAAELLKDRCGTVVAAVVADTGFTIGDAAREVGRGVETLRLCAEEATRLVGEMVPMEGAPGIRERIGFTTYHPLGVVCAITPFNAPINTVLHKLGPAIASGNGIVVKPAEQTPRCADVLLGVLLDAGLPASLIAVAYGPGETVGQWLLEDDRIDFYAFTGSTEVGAHIHRVVGLRHTQLEMGSISSTMICADADLERAVDLVVGAGFRKAGQVCTSVQRLYVERPVVEEICQRLAKGVAARPAGDPRIAETFVGPLITPEAATRVHAWIGEAVAGGAKVIAGGSRDGNVIAPTVLGEVTPEMKVMSSEIFGPVVVIRPFDEVAHAIEEMNDTPYGLAAGIFTASVDRALLAAQRLRVGAVHINETSSSRIDLMPYGGVKASGRGLEGPRYAIREMSEQRLVTLGPSAG